MSQRGTFLSLPLLKCAIHARKRGVTNFGVIWRCVTTSRKCFEIQAVRNSSLAPGTVDKAEFARGQHTAEESIIGHGDVVWNPCNVQMIPDKLHTQIFVDAYRQTDFSTKVIEKCKSHLQEHSLWGQDVKPVAPTSLKLPELQGEDINDHFKNIALQQTFRYRKLLSDLSKSEVPEKPTTWKFTVTI